MLTKTIEKMEFKTQQMETKIDRMKRFQKMIKCSNALQCKVYIYIYIYTI